MALRLLFLEPGDDERGAHRFECFVKVVAHRGDLPDEAGTGVGEALARDDEGGFEAGNFAVGDGLLHFVLKVGEVSHAAEEHGGTDFSREVHRQASELADGDRRGVGLTLDEFRGELQNHVHAFIGCEKRVLARIAAHGDDELVEEAAAAGDDIEMAESHRVERAGVEGDVSGHIGSVPFGPGADRAGDCMPYTITAYHDTPNPNALKCDVEPSPGGGERGAAPRAFRAGEETAGDPIAAALLSVSGVANVLIADGWITIGKVPGTEWRSIKKNVERVLAGL